MVNILLYYFEFLVDVILFKKLVFFKSDQIKETNSHGVNTNAWESYQILIRARTHTHTHSS